MGNSTAFVNKLEESLQKAIPTRFAADLENMAKHGLIMTTNPVVI